MPRISRIVVPGIPHHVIQRGNRRQRVFFGDDDKWRYLHLIKKHSDIAGIEYCAYCLMDNHVHLIAIPRTEKSLAAGLREAHRQYSYIINQREGWRGYLWQGRFLSYPMDQRYFIAAVRYVERNPVRAGLTENAEDFLWSSARAHVMKRQDALISSNSWFSNIDDWVAFLRQPDHESDIELLRKHARTGRPLGDRKFLLELEKLTGRRLIKMKPGRKPKSELESKPEHNHMPDPA